MSEDDASSELHPQSIPPEVHSSLSKYTACNVGLTPGKDFSLMLLLLPLIVARLHFVFVNQPSLCQTAGRSHITKRIKAGRPVMTRLAVFFISEQRVLISPSVTFYSVKAEGYLRLRCTLAACGRHTALVETATHHRVDSCVRHWGSLKKVWNSWNHSRWVKIGAQQ